MSWNVESKPLFPGRDTPGECSPVLCSSSSSRTTSWRPSVEVSTGICHMETVKPKKTHFNIESWGDIKSWHKKIGRILFLRWNSLQTKCLFDWNLYVVLFISSIAPPRHVRTSGRDACWASPPAINQWLNWVIWWVVEGRQISKIDSPFWRGGSA